jgi:hypothetical protein
MEVGQDPNWGCSAEGKKKEASWVVLVANLNPMGTEIPHSVHFFLFLASSSRKAYLSIYDCTTILDVGYFFSFLVHTPSVVPLGRGISPSQGRYLNIEQHKQNEHTQTSIPRVGFELMIPLFEQPKTVNALDRVATVIGPEMCIVN